LARHPTRNRDDPLKKEINELLIGVAALIQVPEDYVHMFVACVLLQIMVKKEMMTTFFLVRPVLFFVRSRQLFATGIVGRFIVHNR